MNVYGAPHFQTYVRVVKRESEEMMPFVARRKGGCILSSEEYGRMWNLSAHFVDFDGVLTTLSPDLTGREASIGVPSVHRVYNTPAVMCVLFLMSSFIVKKSPHCNGKKRSEVRIAEDAESLIGTDMCPVFSENGETLHAEQITLLQQIERQCSVQIARAFSTMYRKDMRPFLIGEFSGSCRGVEHTSPYLSEDLK
jgi:hypothetical protein